MTALPKAGPHPSPPTRPAALTFPTPIYLTLHLLPSHSLLPLAFV